MKRTRHVTTALLLAALATGCSKRGESEEVKAARPSDPNPVATGGESVPLKPEGGDGLASDAPLTFAGPPSFADGEAAYQARSYGDATAIFEHYTTQRPGNAWGYYMLGLSAWKSGDLAKSEQAFEKALSIDPHHVKSLLNSSRVFIEQKRHDEAVDRLKRAADLDPESFHVHRLLGRAYHMQGTTDEAEVSYRRAIEVNERDAWSMNNLVLLFLETERADEALPLLARAVELRQEVPAFHNNLGMALEHTARFRAAATAYRGALAADPGYDKATQNLARVEAVKVDSEEPFDLAEAAQRAVEKAKNAGDQQAEIK